MRTLHFAVGVFILLCLGIPAVFAQNNQPADPKEQLLPFVDRVLEILSDEQLRGEDKKAERRQKIMDLAHQRFDFVETSKRVLPKEQWEELSVEQQDHFVSLFKRLLEYAYISKLEGYADQKVTFVKQRVKGDRAVVQTELIDKEAVMSVYYMMILKDHGWMIYDIWPDKVSIVKNYREQFAEILSKEQYAGLLKQLEERVADLEKNG